MLPVTPGVVTSVDPFLVQLDGEDDAPRPCQRLAPATVGDRGGVLRSGAQRLWLGAYDASDVAGELSERVREIGDQATSAQEALNETSREVSDAVARVDEAQTAAQQAVDDAGAALAALGEAVVDSVMEYAVSASETVAPTTGWSTSTPTRTPGTFVWMRARITRGNEDLTYSAPTLVTGNAGAPGSPGTPGDPGPQGVSITSVVPYYRLMAAGSVAPTPSGATPSGWSTTEPAFTAGMELWRSERINLSNGTYSYTVPQKSSAYAAAIHVGNLAEAAMQGLVKMQATDPGHYPGRLWWQLNAQGQGVGIKVSLNGQWVSYALVADQILVPGSVGSIQLKDGAVTSRVMNADAFQGREFLGGKFTGATFQSQPEANRGVKMSGDGLQQWNQFGTRVGHFMGPKAFLERLTFHDSDARPSQFVPGEVARSDLGQGEIGVGVTSGKDNLNGSEAWLYLTNTGGIELGHSREGYGSVVLIKGNQRDGLDLHGHKRSNTGSVTFNSLAAVANGGTVRELSISHGLGVEPTFASAEIIGSSADRRRWTAQIVAKTANLLTVMVINYTPSATAAGLSTTLMWHVVA